LTPRTLSTTRLSRYYTMMTSCRSIGVVLAAWLLLYPPWSVEKNAIDPTQPLTRWYEAATFDSSAQCEAQKAKVLEQYDWRSHPDLSKVISQMKLRPQARCVADNDPELKER
jgi:hypothetical protein